MIGTTLHDGFVALLGALQDNHPEATIADLEAAWAQLLAGAVAPATPLERHAAQLVADSRAQLAALQALDDAPARTSIESQALAALDANAAFLAKPNRTQADFVAQVDALTRQTNGLIRLLLRRFV